MKSPITGQDMQLLTKNEKLTYRKEEFEVVYHYYFDEENGLEFTTTELDEINLNQALNQYREKYKIPFPGEIKEIREKYGLPANKMAEVLGFGVNVYRQYEAGEMPSVSNGRYIQMVKDAQEFKKVLLQSGVYEGKDLIELITRLEVLIKQEQEIFHWDMLEYFMGSKFPNEYNGYKTPSLDKFLNMVVFFTNACKPVKTKLNKLLFYADFLHFKRTCFSISGTNYIAIQYGPVPKKFDVLFSEAHSRKMIDLRVEYWEDKEKHIFLPVNEYEFNADLFNEEEMNTLNQVVRKLGKCSTPELIHLSHTEKAWIENERDHNDISYKYGFELKSV